MQDVHWPGGAFGYFPSYTLGAMIAAQQWAALNKAIPAAERRYRQGQLRRVNDWRAQAYLVAGLALVDAGPDGARDRREAQRRALQSHLKQRYGAV